MSSSLTSIWSRTSRTMIRESEKGKVVSVMSCNSRRQFFSSAVAICSAHISANTKHETRGSEGHGSGRFGLEMCLHLMTKGKSMDGTGTRLLIVGNTALNFIVTFRDHGSDAGKVWRAECHEMPLLSLRKSHTELFSRAIPRPRLQARYKDLLSTR